MKIENLFNNPLQETPKQGDQKQKQLIKESNPEEQNLSETVIAPENLRECGPEIVELEEMLVSFELIHSLAELQEQYEQWMKDHPETVIAPEDLRECGPEIAEFEEMLVSFELMHSLSELHSIIDLKPEDTSKYPLRESAKAALIPIVAKLNILKKETNIASEKHEELKAKYKLLSRAVGIINSNNKVDHNR